jgi:hypothetical protein
LAGENIALMLKAHIFCIGPDDCAKHLVDSCPSKLDLIAVSANISRTLPNGRRISEVQITL